MERILVVLPNWFGETLFATPFLRALREQCRSAEITALGWPACRHVLLHNPHLHAFIEYDERGRHRSPSGKWRLLRAVRQGRFDTAFILRKSLSRTLLLWMAGIPTRIGFANPKSGWLLTHQVQPSTMPIHKASTYLPLLEAAGLSIVAGPYEYTVSEEEQAAARELLKRERIVNRRPLVVVHPGANWPHKRWAPERFAALANRLVERHQAQVLITGAPADRDMAQIIHTSMSRPAVMLAGRTTLRELAACLPHAQLVISNDTGVLHIAAALHRPLVALYGPTSPALTGPLGDPTRMSVLHHAECCPQIPCFHPDRPPHPGMDAITVEEAYDASADLLEQG